MKVNESSSKLQAIEDFTKELFCSSPSSKLRGIKLTAFGGTFLATLPIFAIITNPYTIKLTAFGGTFLATLPIFAIITNSYTIKLKL